MPVSGEPTWTFTADGDSISFLAVSDNEEAPLWKAPARVSERPLIGTFRSVISIFGRSSPRIEATIILDGYDDYALTVTTLDGKLGVLDRGHAEEEPITAMLLVNDQKRIRGSDTFRLAVLFIAPG